MLAFDELEQEQNLDIKVFVSNLGAYNAGQLTGEWVKLPVKNISDIYKHDREKSGNVLGYGEEYFITDYEAPFKINEYDSLDELNKLAKSFKENELKTIEDVYNFLDDSSEILEHPYEFNGDLSEIAEGMTAQEVGRAVFFGNIRNFNDDYIRFDGYGNFESLNEYEWQKELKDHASEIIDQYKEENL